MVTNDNKNYQSETLRNKTKTDKPWVCECGRAYKYRSGLSRHKSGCILKESSIENVKIQMTLEQH